ncbi:hypothetical protein M8C21_025516, partial [Ambrosia artemisiifolia]
TADDFRLLQKKSKKTNINFPKLKANGTSSPPALCVYCMEGEICLEASTHVQEMKDRLISVLNDLVIALAAPNDEGRTQKLYQERNMLNERIKNLEEKLPNASPHITNRKENHDSHVETELRIMKYKEVKHVRNSDENEWTSDNYDWSKDLKDFNTKVFGNDDIRTNQRGVMNATLSDRDVFVTMPTGSGKSLTYMVNVSAVTLSAELDQVAWQKLLRDISNNKYKLVYVTPEKLMNLDLIILKVDYDSEKSKKAGNAPATSVVIDVLKNSHQGSHEILLLEEKINFNSRAASFSVNYSKQELRQGGSYLLVATDIAGRGVDLPDTTHIYNFDLPKDAVHYLHRAGRTGRKPFSEVICGRSKNQKVVFHFRMVQVECVKVASTLT